MARWLTVLLPFDCPCRHFFLFTCLFVTESGLNLFLSFSYYVCISFFLSQGIFQLISYNHSQVQIVWMQPNTECCRELSLPPALPGRQFQRDLCLSPTSVIWKSSIWSPASMNLIISRRELLHKNDIKLRKKKRIKNVMKHCFITTL